MCLQVPVDDFNNILTKLLTSGAVYGLSHPWELDDLYECK